MQEKDGQAIKAVLRSAPAELTRIDVSFPATAARNGAELAPAQGARVPSRLLASPSAILSTITPAPLKMRKMFGPIFQGLILP